MLREAEETSRAPLADISLDSAYKPDCFRGSKVFRQFGVGVDDDLFDASQIAVFAEGIPVAVDCQAIHLVLYELQNGFL